MRALIPPKDEWTDYIIFTLIIFLPFFLALPLIALAIPVVVFIISQLIS
jgi:hypothetical protein